MLICPNGHTAETGKYCAECRGEMRDATADAGIRLRSPDAHATATVNPTFVLPGASAPGRAAERVKCAECGRKPLVEETFDCRGPCGRADLCLEHFDKELRVCEVCARERRGEAARAAAEWAALTLERDALRAERDAWLARAEQAEGALSEIRRKEAVAAEAAQVQPLWQKIGIELIRIPECSFLYGENNDKVRLQGYWLAKTPVTNAQYKAFVDATGHRVPDHWLDGRILAGKEQHPVVCVDCQDVAAFCQWVGLALPTEKGWERAARGTRGRHYPWGAWAEGRCNTAEAGIGGTTPVDRYPNGASPSGLLDMAGNVWEWCADWYDSRQKLRVLRGGSWFTDREVARATFRGSNVPSMRTTNYGFRCARSD